MKLTLLQLAAAFGIGGSLLAVAVPAFVRNLHASKLSEPVDNLSKIVGRAVAYGDTHAEPDVFPPSVELTPASVPRGAPTTDPPGTWDHLSWRALDFRIDEPHSFSYEFKSAHDPTSGKATFVVTAHGDLDGDGSLSTFTAYGEKARGAPARALPGLYIEHELE